MVTGHKLIDMRGMRGFTLVELVIVFALIAIMAAIAVPNVYRFYQLYKFNEYAFQIEAIVREAKIKAIETSQHVAVCVQGRSIEVKLMNSYRGNDCSGGTLYKRITVNDGWLNLNQNNILLWDPRGLSVFSGNLCMAGAGRHFRVIYQTNRGLVRVSGGVGGC